MSEETRLRELLELRDLVDELVERAQMEHQSLAMVLGTLLPAICEKIGARGAFLESYDEDLNLAVYKHPRDLAIPEWDALSAATSETERQNWSGASGSVRVVAQPLDVAGTWFGRAGLVVDAASPLPSDEAARKLHLACEELDNYLFAIRNAREKHLMMMDLGRALRHRVLGEGLRLAEEALAKAMPLDRMLMVLVADEGSTSKTLHVRLFEDGKIKIDTLGGEADPKIRELGRAYLFEDRPELLEHLQFRGAQEEVLINGVTHGQLVGKVLVTSKTGSFNTYGREILAGFAGFVRQRIVDFNKEWRRLAASFRPEDVARLVGLDDYEAKYLAPREETVGILYVDIAGFTRVSEQVLRTPAAVAKLVEQWGDEAVNLVWKHGGVFDKMVGDCVIALFGPPFYEETPGARLASAIECAKEIRAMTEAFPEREGFEVLRDGGLSVSTGVNLAPLFVGSFGPNSNFTGFSSGMNNTARLQGCATRGKIFVMEEARVQLPEGAPFVFGDLESAAVKNVAQPLRFRELK